MSRRARVWEILSYSGGMMLAISALLEMVDEEGRYQGTLAEIATRARQPVRACGAALRVLARDGIVSIRAIEGRVNEYQLDREFLRQLDEEVQEAAA